MRPSVHRVRHTLSLTHTHTTIATTTVHMHCRRRRRRRHHTPPSPPPLHARLVGCCLTHSWLSRAWHMVRVTVRSAPQNTPQRPQKCTALTQDWCVLLLCVLVLCRQSEITKHGWKVCVRNQHMRFSPSDQSRCKQHSGRRQVERSTPAELTLPSSACMCMHSPTHATTTNTKTAYKNTSPTKAAN